jgi:hypothetical protein
MRRLIPPTLRQWGCAHHWKEQSTKVLGDKLHRVRYYFCQRCQLRVKTREAPEVPWDEGTLMAVMAQVFPEGEVTDAATLREQGLLGGACRGSMRASSPMAGGWTWCAARGGWWVWCDGEFHQEAPGRTNRKRRQGRIAPPLTIVA